MYTIKQAAARTGISVPTIRVWERRYAVVDPARTPAGYRLYDDVAIARLQAMQRLVERDGWRPSQASERVREVGDDPAALAALGREADVEASAGRAPGAAGEAPGPTTDGVAAFYAAARQLDVDGLDQVLDDAFARQRFEGAMRDVVFPALRAIGEGWSTGDVDVAAEHAASETVRRRLSQLYEAAGRGSAGPVVLVGLPPGSHHEIGAFAFAVAARRSGLGVLYLGSDVPLESWLRTARETGAPIVVLGVVTEADVASATVVAEGLGTLASPPRCFLGGPANGEIALSAGVSWLPEPLEAAIGHVRAAIDPQRP
jgi:methanogenic corrinoid protein MtbC1